jgi:uncharacterized protein (DUF433 family)
MSDLPTNEYVEVREGRYYVAGTRIGLDVLIYDFRRGETPEAILQAYPTIGSLAKAYGVITFILEHPEAVDHYLQEQDANWKQFRDEHPIPEAMLDRFYRTREEVSRRAG